MSARVVLVPGCLALLPAYSSLHDPVAELRAACLAGVGWLGPDVRVVAGPQGERVAAALLQAVAGSGWSAEGRSGGEYAAGPAYLVVGNGSACRTEKAPGYLDERAKGFDAELGRALGLAGGAPEPQALRAVDLDLARELWADVAVLPRVAELLDGATTVGVDYDDDPYGVQYWVARWERRVD